VFILFHVIIHQRPCCPSSAQNLAVESKTILGNCSTHCYNPSISYRTTPSNLYFVELRIHKPPRTPKSVIQNHRTVASEQNALRRNEARDVLLIQRVTFFPHSSPILPLYYRTQIPSAYYLLSIKASKQRIAQVARVCRDSLEMSW
jgi:hypothetical protein